MRAVRFHGRGDIRLDEVDEPVCGSGQVKVWISINHPPLEYSEVLSLTSRFP